MHLAEQPRGATHVQIGCVGDELVEGGPDRLEEKALARRKRRVLERAADDRRARPLPDDRLVEVRGRPLDQTRVDLLLELEDPLRHAARGGDHDDDHDAGLELQHLDVAHRGGLERRR